MKVVINIGGMHCEHCVKRIKGALENIGNIHADVFLEEGKAILLSDDDIDLEEVQKVIEEEDFQYLGVKE